MASILKPGEGFLYMKVGTHARETLEDIVARKRKEIEEAGYALWGYGGSTCHPLSMVQPFARDYVKKAGRIYLCMQPMDSKHFAEPLRASKMSIDGVAWEEIPAPVNCKGSRYALVIKDLRQEHFDISLQRTKVAIGNSMGRAGDAYIAGRVDKACLEAQEGVEVGQDDEKRIHIGLVAEIVDPYAVFLKD
jgi:hypothetical protein